MGFIEIVEEEETFELEMGESILGLRRFDTDVYNRIVKKHTTRKKNHRTGQVNEETDDAAVNKELLDYMIRYWKVVKSPTTGEDVPCTLENKVKLPGSVKLQITEACDAESITSEKKTKPPSSDDL